MNKIFTLSLFGHLLLFTNTVLAENGHAARFSLNVGNVTTLSLSPSSTFGDNRPVALIPHPSNSKKYDQLAYAEENDVAINKNVEGSTKDNPNLCSDSEFGVEFYCEPTWKWRRVEDAILIIISSQPMVTMTISKINSPVKLLGQITDSYIRERGLYSEGFQAERVKFMDGEAVHVKAISLKFPDIRVSDYFYVQNNVLYGVLFSVKPKEDWDNHKFTIQNIVQSFKKLNF